MAFHLYFVQCPGFVEQILDKFLLNKFVLLQQMLLNKILDKVTNPATNLITNRNRPVPGPGVRMEPIPKKPPPAAAACPATAATVAPPSTTTGWVQTLTPPNKIFKQAESVNQTFPYPLIQTDPSNGIKVRQTELNPLNMNYHSVKRI